MPDLKTWCTLGAGALAFVLSYCFGLHNMEVRKDLEIANLNNELTQSLLDMNQVTRETEVKVREIQAQAENTLESEREKQNVVVNDLNRMLRTLRSRLSEYTPESHNGELPAATAVTHVTKKESFGEWKRTLDNCIVTAGELATERDELAVRLNTLIDLYESTREEINANESKRHHSASR